MTRFIFSLVLSLFLVAPVGAQTVAPGSTVVPETLKNIRVQVKENFQQEKQNVKDAMRTEARERLNALKIEEQKIKLDLKQVREMKPENMPTILEAKKKEIQAFREEQKENLKAQMEIKKEERKQILEEEKTELKEKLQVVKDERKKALTENISERMNALNENQTKHFTEVLDKLTAVLDRTSDRLDETVVKRPELDATTARQAITDAQTAIDAARLAVQNQTGKVYTFTVNTADTLKTDVGAARQQLEQDLKQTREIIKTAYETVHNALVAVGNLLGKTTSE